MSKQDKLAIAACIGCNVIFGFSFLFSKVSLEYVSPVTLLGLRYTLAFLVCNLLLLTGLFRISFRGKPLRDVIAMAIFSPGLYAILETVGIDLTGAFFSGIMIALIPIVSTLIAAIGLKEKTSGLQIACALLSFSGVILTAFGGRAGAFSLPGLLCLLIAVLCAGFHDVLNRKTSVQFTPFERVYLLFALAMAIYLPAALVENRGHLVEKMIDPLGNMPLIWGLLFLGVLSSVLAFGLMNYAATHMPVARSAVFGNLITVVAIFAGVVILREHISWVQAVGSALIVAGVYGVNRAPREDSLACRQDAS